MKYFKSYLWVLHIHTQPTSRLFEKWGPILDPSVFSNDLLCRAMRLDSISKYSWLGRHLFAMVFITIHYPSITLVTWQCLRLSLCLDLSHLLPVLLNVICCRTLQWVLTAELERRGIRDSILFGFGSYRIYNITCSLMKHDLYNFIWMVWPNLMEMTTDNNLGTIDTTKTFLKGMMLTFNC